MPETTEKVISVAFTVDEKYIPYATTALVSLFMNNGNELFNVYIIYNTISESSKSKIISSCKNFDHQIIFIKIDDSFLANAPITHHISLAAYYRLSLVNLLPVELDKILYFDADIFIRKSIRKLWDANISDYALAATIAAGMDDYPKELLLKESSLYFNSGIMLINLNYWRKIDVYNTGIALIKDQPERIKWWDQDILNIIFENKWLPVSLEWNAQPYIFDEIGSAPESIKSKYKKHNYLQAKTHPTIVHYAGGTKPWTGGSNLPFAAEYFNYFNKTSWKPGLLNKTVIFFKKCFSKITHAK